MSNYDRHRLLADVFQGLAHAVRLHAIELLRNGPLCVCELVPALGVDQATASRHLSILRRAGLVTANRAGTRVIYRLASVDVPALLDVATAIVRSHVSKSAASVTESLTLSNLEHNEWE